MAVIEGLYIGEISTLEPSGERTGMFKNPVSSVVIERDGLVGDHQADRRFHGGRDKAVHQFAQSAYTQIAEVFPRLTEQLCIGTMGENISSSELCDSNVLIGDIYRFGGVLLQVSEPRRPCWKINTKFNDEKLAAFIESEAISGWYYRVLERGSVFLGDEITLEDRDPSSFSIAAFTRTITQHRPTVAALKDLMGCCGISSSWKKKLRDRIKFLENV